MYRLAALAGALLLSSFGSAHPHNELDKRATVPYGKIITSCTNGNVALTFDDGPHIYTSELLDLLKANNMKATFFVNGDNYGDIYTYTALLQRMIAEGHQIGSHTYVLSMLSLSIVPKDQLTRSI
jgi:peptidoglycan/xylan/chitin deacetylase (PgdA/CDA1 family)